jgi:DnaJ-class molecular chaperone
MKNDSQQQNELEIICSECDGNGGETELGKWFPCDKCAGAGYIPTPAGQKVLSLMRHNLRAMKLQTRAD